MYYNRIQYGVDYAPIFMEPAMFSIFSQTQRPVYYSCNYHTAIRLAQKSSSRSSMVSDLYAVRSLLMKYLQSIQQDNLNIAGTPLHEVAKVVDYTFFHHDNSEELPDIYPSAQLLQEDPSFAQACEQSKIKEMPKNPPFLNGCVRIAGKHAK